MTAGLAGILFLGVLEAAWAGSQVVDGERRIVLQGRELDVTWDAASRAPLTIYGIDGDLLAVENVSSLTRKEINEVGLLLAEKYAPLLRVRAEDLVPVTAEKTGGSWYVTFRQTVRGMAVHDSSLGFSIRPDGRIRSLGARLYPDVPAPGAVRVDRAEALKAARIHLRETEKGAYRVAADSMAVYPERKSGSIDYRLVYIIDLFPRRPTHPASAAGGYEVFVDAVNGEIVRTRPLVKTLGCCLPAGGSP